MKPGLAHDSLTKKLRVHDRILILAALGCFVACDVNDVSRLQSSSFACQKANDCVEAGIAPDADRGFLDAMDMTIYPDASVVDAGAQPDAETADSGEYADAEIIDSGMHLDAAMNDSGMHTDAAMNDSGMHLDAAMNDSGMHSDAAMIDSGMHSDAATLDSGSGLWAVICPENPRTDDSLYVVENLDCASSTGITNLPLPPLAVVQWRRRRNTGLSNHQDPLTADQTQKGDQISATVTYLLGNVPSVVTPEVTIENSPPGMPHSSLRRLVITPNSIPGQSFMSYSENSFAKGDDTVKCLMDGPTTDADSDPLNYYLTLQLPGPVRTSSQSATTHDIAIEQTLNIANPSPTDFMSCIASVRDSSNAITSSTTRVEFCEKEYATFSGSQYIEFAEHSGFRIENTGTMEAWVYWQGGQTQSAIIYSRWWSNNSNTQLAIDPQGQLYGILSRLVLPSLEIYTTVTDPSDTIDLEKWTHVAMTWDSNGSMYLFINGERKAEESLQAMGPSLPLSSGGPPLLGTAPGRSFDSFFGSITSFRISSTVRYDHNVDFTPDRNYGFDADTQVFIPLDEGSPTANVTATQRTSMGGTATFQSTSNTSLWSTERCLAR